VHIDLNDRAHITALQLAIDMHKSGKTIAWIRRKMKDILVDENDNPLDASFLPNEFSRFGYDFKKMEESPEWKRLHKKIDRRREKDLDQRYEEIKRVFIERWKDGGIDAALADGFPEGWRKLIGADEDYYDIYIDRYTKRGLITVWKDKGEFWWWKAADHPEGIQVLSKYEAIDAAEARLKKLDEK
jgi:hypothetical protein